MAEMLYDQSSVVIAIVLLVLMALAIELGYRVGHRNEAGMSEAAISDIRTVQSSLLGIFALMLGFTFSIALDRHNGRSLAVVDEANAIGTAHLRTALLPDAAREEIRRTLKAYVNARTQASQLPLNDHASRERLLNEAVRLQDVLWASAAAAARQDPNPVTTGLFVQSLNEMIDSYGRRSAELNRHVPEWVLMMLYGSFIVMCGILGYVAGVSRYRPARATYLMTFLVVLLMAMVVDLDRPRRGLIQVSQQPLIELNAVISNAK